LSELTAEAAREMSRAEALRVMAEGHGVAPSDRRLAHLMLAGPDVTPADEQRLRGFKFRPQLMAGSVHLALREIGAEADWNRKAAEDDIAELGGVRR
jgi:hypothetical protein